MKRAIADEKLLTPDFVAKAQTASIGLAAALRQIVLTTPPALRTPTCPTLVIWGEHDRLSSVENGKRVAAEINGAKFKIIPHAAHLPQIEQPEAFHQVVLPFLLGTASESGVRLSSIALSHQTLSLFTNSSVVKCRANIQDKGEA